MKRALSRTAELIAMAGMVVAPTPQPGPVREGRAGRVLPDVVTQLEAGALVFR